MFRKHNITCLCKWQLPSKFPVKCSSHTRNSKSTPTLREGMCLRPLGRPTTNSSSLQRLEERTCGFFSVKSAESVLVGLECLVEGFSARGFWVRLSPELSRFLIQISFRFRKWDWVKYYDMSRDRTTHATMYVLILSTSLNIFSFLEELSNHLYIYIYIKILIEFGIPRKLVRLINMNLTETYSKVRVGKNMSDRSLLGMV